MRLQEVLSVGLCFLASVLAQDEPDPTTSAIPTPTGIDVFANVTLYQPDDTTTQLTGPRTGNIPNNTVLAAWNDPSSNGSIAVYRSTNNGFSWYPFASATSESNQKLLQPHLLYINATEDYENGIVLLAVNAVSDAATAIELYSSEDLGESWDLAGQIATGGSLNGSTAVADPFLFSSPNKLTIFYTGKEEILQKTTTVEGDFESWDSAVDVVASGSQTGRPSSPSIAKIASNKYILAFQSPLINSNNTTTYPISYIITSNPQRPSGETIRKIRVDTGKVPSGAPSVTWTPLGGANGTIVLSDSRSSSVFINQAQGEGEWREVGTTAGRALGREVVVPSNDQTKVRFAAGAEWKGMGQSQVLITVMDFAKALGKVGFLGG